MGLVTTGDGENGTSQHPAPRNAEELELQMLEQLEGQRDILHTTITTVSQSGTEIHPMYVTELWIDADSETARSEFRKDPGWEADLAEQAISLVVGEFAYLQDDPGEALRRSFENDVSCATSSIVSLLWDCGSPAHVTTAKGGIPFEPTAVYDGEPVYALTLADGYAHTEGSPDYTIVSRTYIDPNGLLPTARVTEYEQQSPPGERSEIRSSYEHELIQRDSLPDDFFDPRSIGYGLADVQTQLDEVANEVPVYWLGEEPAPGNGLDELVLVRIDTNSLLSETGEAAGDVAAVLSYETPEGLTGVNLVLRTPVEFDEFILSDAGSYLLDPDCAQSNSAMTPAGEATIYTLPDVEFPLEPEDLGPCVGRTIAPDFGFANVVAIIELDGVVIDVRSDPTGDFESREAIEAVLAGLRSYK